MFSDSLKCAQGVATLLNLENVGPATAYKLVEMAETVGDLLSVAGETDRKPGVNQKVRVTAASLEIAYEKAERVLAATRAFGGEVLSPFDAGYPARLAQIPDAPMLIHVLGDISAADRSAAVVGARAATRYGLAVTRRISQHLVDNGYTIVSGLADGVDSAAHEVALADHGVTVAAVGHGLDRFRSPQIRAIADRIVSSGGAIVCENPIGTEADPNLLIRRNRIISGLSNGVFVTQAEISSGTMHTVRYALLQQRQLFVPAPIPEAAGEPMNRGNLALISQTGRQLADTLKVKPPVREILERDFSDVSPVFAIRSRDDYPAMMQMLGGPVLDPAPALAV